MFIDTFLQKIDELLLSLVKTSFKRGALFEDLNGHYECDCSGLISSLLLLCSKNYYAQIKGNRESLKAVDYFALTEEETIPIKWHQRIDQLSSGQCLVWKKQKIPKSGDSGHIAVALDSPVEIKEGLWAIKVLDSSKLPHDQDSRQDGANGIGVGIMYLLVRDSIIEGYIWSSEIKKNKRVEIRCISFY